MPQQAEMLASEIPPGTYLTPALLHVTPQIPRSGQAGPIRLLLTLEGGFELDIPVSPASIGELFQSLVVLR